MEEDAKKQRDDQESTGRQEQLRILEAFGKFDFDPAYDYKAERGMRRVDAVDLAPPGWRPSDFGGKK